MKGLDKKNNSGNLICRYKGNTADVKFDNAPDIINKIRNGEINLADVKNNQVKFKSDLGEIKKETTKKDQKSKKTLCKILKCVTKQGTRLLNFEMIIL